MRCDLHVHTIHSGMCTVPVFDRICRESYNDPDEVYDTLKRRGMDLVTVTDHDSIDAVEGLRRRPGFFLSEEITCHTSSGTELHVGVYGIDERDHLPMQARRDDLPRLLAYLRERGLLFSVNHVFSGLTGKRLAADYDEFAAFPAFEILNGQMLPAANRYARQWAASARKLALAGSDSHTMHCLGKTWTEVPGARTAAEFLDGLKAGAAKVGGESGGYLKLSRAIFDVSCAMIREQSWTLALSPLMAGIPLASAWNILKETCFAHTWGRHVQRKLQSNAPQTAARPLAQHPVCAID